MTKIQIKRVYEEPASSDGFRVLVDKLWPRGIEKEKLSYSLWARDITPSTPLRTWFHEDPEQNWDGFEERYIHELNSSKAVKDFIDKIKGKKKVTLLYASKNARENHALILQHYLEDELNKVNQ